MVTGSITCLIWSVFGWSLALLPVLFGLCLDGHWLYYLSYLVCVWMVTGSVTCLICIWKDDSWHCYTSDLLCEGMLTDSMPV